MTVTEAPPRPIFGPITIEQMRDEAVTRAVFSVVREACKHSKGRFTVDGVAQGLASGEMLLYGVLRPPSATLDATVVARPRENVFEVLVAGPQFDDVAPFMELLEKLARGARCERMAIWGPPWFKNHLPNGWFMREVRFERVL